MCLHVLNGYNTFIYNNKKKSVGVSFNYTFNDKLSLGYYNLYGNEVADSVKGPHLRGLNNLVLTFQLSKAIKAIVGADYIFQQHSQLKDPGKSAIAYSLIATLRCQLTKKMAAYVRGETFSDTNGMLTGVITDSKMNATGYKLNDATLGFEVKPLESAFIRLEGRSIFMDSNQKIFHDANSHSNSNIRMEAFMNLGVWF